LERRNRVAEFNALFACRFRGSCRGLRSISIFRFPRSSVFERFIAGQFQMAGTVRGGGLFRKKLRCNTIITECNGLLLKLAVRVAFIFLLFIFFQR